MINITHSRAGKGRENEDRLETAELSTNKLLAVMADGMGGLDHGEVAAEIAVNELVQILRISGK